MKQSTLYTSILLLLVISQSFGQINHYWMSQIGARSNMLGGAVVGSVRDNSSILYNPGGMAFIDNSSLSVMGLPTFLECQAISSFQIEQKGYL